MPEPIPQKDTPFEKGVLNVFDLALVFKVIGGALEIVAGLLVLLVPPRLVLGIVEFFTGGELGQDSDDAITSGLNAAAQSFAVHSHYLLAGFLALRGIVKVVLVMGVMRGKKVAYQWFMLALVIFASYELYRGIVRDETLLLALVVFDLTVLALTAYEYGRRYHPLPSPEVQKSPE